jgi:hypothetical protein
MTHSLSVSSVIMQTSAFFYCYAECRYAECRYAECRYTGLGDTIFDNICENFFLNVVRTRR